MIHVRTEGDGPARACEPADLVVDDRASAPPPGTTRIRAETPIALAADGPFEVAAIAVERDGALRDRLAAAVPTPSLAAWSRVRWAVLAAAAVPALMLVELDRELFTVSGATTARIVGDAAVAAYLVWELTRRTPRMPGVAAWAAAAVALRWALFATRLCGSHVHPIVWIALGLATGATAAIATRAPARARAAMELLGKLGVSRADALAAKLPPEGSGKLVAAAALGAIGLPLVAVLLGRAGIGLEAQGALFVAYGVLVPMAARRAFDGAASGPSAARPAARVPPAATALAIASGFVLTAALVNGAHSFFDAGAELARCTGRLDAEARRALAEQADEIARTLAGVRASTAATVMGVAIGPFVEERLYRDLLMNALARKYGAAYGLFASAIVFGVAHAGTYELALYQTVLLGVAFGVAYAEGGLLAAFTVHAAWNLLRLA